MVAGLATYVSVLALEGKDIPAFVKVPLPIIDNSNIDHYLARAKDFPADGYIYSPYSLDMFDKLLASQ
jgi:ribose transport system substrate-binding protein